MFSRNIHTPQSYVNLSSVPKIRSHLMTKNTSRVVRDAVNFG
jgi:hypothetical protein